MIQKNNLDFILFNLETIVESTKSCIEKSSNISYVKEYKENLFSLIDILDSVEIIQNEIFKNNENELN